MANAYYAYYALHSFQGISISNKTAKMLLECFDTGKEVDIGPITLVPYMSNDLVLLLFSTLLFPSLC